jgi:2-polyprenyl-3-methyl-5-hydroxy-6-metoxy-1,4-benzoquinol methylase
MKDLTEYRQKDLEKERTKDLMNLVPSIGGSALDIGARDGHFSKILAERFDDVTALDLKRPCIDYPKVHCVEGDVTCLDFDDNAFDLVLCAEVLEHIPKGLLARACMELGRVVKGYLLIGVPYRQDLRVAQTTCYSCGKTNPPWGHVNRFDVSF